MKFHNQKDWKIKKSKIHGKGVYTTRKFSKNEKIGVGIDFWYGFFPFVTRDFGSWINHSYKPNTHLKYSNKDGVHYVVASKNLPENTEITLDYRNTPFYIQGPAADFK